MKGDSLMKKTPKNGFNEDFDSKFGYEDLDLLVSDSDLLLDRHPLVNDSQTEIGESQNMQCNVVMLPTEFKKSKDKPEFQTYTTSWGRRS